MNKRSGHSNLGATRDACPAAALGLAGAAFLGRGARTYPYRWRRGHGLLFRWPWGMKRHTYVIQPFPQPGNPIPYREKSPILDEQHYSICHAPPASEHNCAVRKGDLGRRCPVTLQGMLLICILSFQYETFGGAERPRGCQVSDSFLSQTKIPRGPM